MMDGAGAGCSLGLAPVAGAAGVGKDGRGQARRGSPSRKDERTAAGVPGASEEAGQANRGKGGAHSKVLRERSSLLQSWGHA